MDFKSEYQKAEKILKDGHYDACVTKCSGIFEVAFKEIYQTYLSSLTTKKERDEIQAIEDEIGKHQETFKKFGFGQLVGLANKAKLFNRLKTILEHDLEHINLINFGGLVEIRNKVTHEGREVTEMDANLFLINLKTFLLDTRLIEPALPDEKDITLKDGVKNEELKCPNCNELIELGWKICPYCKEKLKQDILICPFCEKEINKNWDVCPFCGEKTKKIKSGKIKKVSVHKKYKYKIADNELRYFINDINEFMTINNSYPFKFYGLDKLLTNVLIIEHKKTITVAAVSNDQSKVITGSEDRTAKLWDAHTGALLYTLEGHDGHISTVEFSPDDSIVITSAGGTVKIWDAKKGTLLHALIAHSDYISYSYFNSNGTKLLTSSDDGTTKIWEVDSGAQLKVLQGDENEGTVYSAAFSPDDSKVITGNEYCTAIIWNSDTGEILHTLEGHDDSVYSVAFSPDGSKVITGSVDEIVKIWDANTGKLLDTLEVEIFPSYVAFSQDGSQIIIRSSEVEKTWDVKNGDLKKTIRDYSLKNIKNVMVFNPEGIQIIKKEIESEKAEIWNKKKKSLIPALMGNDSNIYPAAFTSNGLKVITGTGSEEYEGDAYIWDLNTGERLQILEGHESKITSVAFSPDGSKVITGSQDRNAKIWDTNTGALLHTLEGHEDYILSVAFSPDGSKVVTGSEDKTAKIWEVNTGQELQTLQGYIEGHGYGYVESVAFSPDGSKAVTGHGSYVSICDIETGDLLISIHEPEHAMITFVAFSPDGLSIITGNEDHIVKLWNIKKGTCLRTLKGHENPVSTAYFNSTGDKIISCSKEAVIIWSVDYEEKQ